MKFKMFFTFLLGKPKAKPVDPPEPAVRRVDPVDLDTLARTIYGEARNQGRAGREAIACVVLNRVKKPSWWSRNKDEFKDDTVAAVCRDPFQFSCWNLNDPNRKIIEKVTIEDRIFAECLIIAEAALLGVLSDITKGANHYHEKSIHPYWIEKNKPVAFIGDHVFYNLK